MADGGADGGAPTITDVAARLAAQDGGSDDSGPGAEDAATGDAGTDVPGPEDTATDATAAPAFFTRRQRRDAARAAAVHDDTATGETDVTASVIRGPLKTEPPVTAMQAAVAAPALSVAAAQVPDVPDTIPPPLSAPVPDRMPERVIDRPVITERPSPRAVRSGPESAGRAAGPSILSRAMSRITSRGTSPGSAGLRAPTRAGRPPSGQGAARPSRTARAIWVRR
jgi:hypothetical protein